MGGKAVQLVNFASIVFVIMFTFVAVAFTSSQAQYQPWINHSDQRTYSY